VTAQLIQSSDGTHLWSERYDRDLTDVFAIQDEIGQAISEALQVRLAPRTRVLNVDAWQHWLKGVHHRARNTPDGFAKAKAHFEKALAIDPNYAQAYSGLALTYYVLAVMDAAPASELKPLAILAAEKALAIDPSDSGVVHGVSSVSGNFRLRLEPGREASLEVRYGRTCLAAGALRLCQFLSTSHRTTDRGNRTKPAGARGRSAVYAFFIPVWSGAFFPLDNPRRRIVCARRAMEIDPNFHLVWLHMGLAQLGAGLPDEAGQQLQTPLWNWLHGFISPTGV